MNHLLGPIPNGRNRSIAEHVRRLHFTRRRPAIQHRPPGASTELGRIDSEYTPLLPGLDGPISTAPAPAPPLALNMPRPGWPVNSFIGPFPLCPRDYDRSQGLMKGLPPFPRLPRVCQPHMSRVHCPVMLAPVYPVADLLRLFVRCAGNQYLVLSSLVVCHQRITCPSGYHTACPAFLGDLIRSHPDPPLNNAFRLEKSDSRHHPTMCNNGSILAVPKNRLTL